MAVNRNQEQLRDAAQFIKRGDYKSAQAIFRELIKASPRDAELWYLYSFAATEKDHQTKSLEKALSLVPDHAKAKARLAQLRGEAPVPPRTTPKPAPSSMPLVAGGVASLIVVALIVGFIMNRGQGTDALASTIQPPSATVVIVTRTPTDEGDAPTETPTAESAALLPETPTQAAADVQPTFVPTSTRRPTNTPIVPTSTPTIPYVPEIISTPSPIDVPLADLTEFGGGTGRLLYSSSVFIDLSDGSRSRLTLPEEIDNAWWVSDGRQVMVSKDFGDKGCNPDPDQRATPQACVGFMDVASGAMRMIDGIPLISYLDLSPDRSMIAYVGVDQQLWVVNVDGTQARSLTNYSERHMLARPIWTPDGRFITYTYQQGDLNDIHIIALDGSGDRMFIHDAWAIQWLPDGSGLLYMSELRGNRQSESHLLLANADGTQARQLTPWDTYWALTGVAVSPDGRLVAFSGGNGLYVMSIDGSRVTKLFDENSTLSDISWEPLPVSADATATPTPTITPTLPSPTPLSVDDLGGGTGRIIFTNHPYDPRFNVIDLHDGSVSALALPALSGQIENVTWVSDGRQLMVTKRQDAEGCDPDPAQLATPMPCLGFMDVASGVVHMIEGIPINGSQALSPDLSLIAYVGVDQQLWVAKVDGSQARSLTSHTGEHGVLSPVWTPDGRFIAYTYDDDTHLIALDGSDDHLLIPDGSVNAWTPDGRSLFYVTRASFQPLLFIANADGTQARQLTPTGKYENLHGASVSPNGQLVAFVTNDGIYVLNVASGEATQLVDTRGISMFYSNLSWEPQPAAAGATATPTATITPIHPTPTPLSTSEVGGGTGRILFPYRADDGFTTTFRLIDLRDGTSSDLALPQGIVSAQWASDGLQLVVSREQGDKCVGINTNYITATPEPCVGFMTVSSGSLMMIQNLGIAAQVALSSDMRQIAYISEGADPGQELWVANIDGTNRRQITYEADSWPSGPVWSPDGRLIAYSRTIPGSSNEQIHLVSPDGTGDTILTSGEQPAWSPDGTSLAYVNDEQFDERMMIIDVSGENAREIFVGESSIGSPVWSPDGQLIAYTYKEGLYIMKADGTGARRVAEAIDGSLHKPSWQSLPPAVPGTATPTPRATPTIPTATPPSIEDVGGGTGTILYYETGADSEHPAAYKVFNLRDGSFGTLPLPQDSGGLRWADDGRHFLVTRIHQTTECTDLTSQEQARRTCIGLMDSQTMATTLLPVSENSAGFDLSPDGSMIAFIQPDYDNTHQVWVMRVDGTDLHQVTAVAGGISADVVRWTPDGRFITYVIATAAGKNIHLISPDGTGDRLLVQNGMSPDWSPDGSVLAYAAEEAGGTYIYTVNADGTNRRKLTYGARSRLSDLNPIWSPNGRLIAFLRYDTWLYVMRADGADQRVIAQAYPNSNLLNVSWQPQPASAPVATYTPMPTLMPRPPVMIATAVPAADSTIGGGTGRILYSAISPNTNQFNFHTVDLNDLSISDMTFPEGVFKAQWLADGQRYMVSKSQSYYYCLPESRGNQPGGTREPCLGVMNADSQEVRLFGNFPYMVSPVMSPDMNWIAYFDRDEDKAVLQVFVINVDGTRRRQLTNYKGIMPSDLVWSSDGRSLAYTVAEADNMYRIDRVSIEGGDEAVFLEDAMMPAWSPDGMSLAYVGADQPYGTHHLFIANTDGTNPRQIITSTQTYDAKWPVWSPDSTLVAYVVKDGVGHTLYVMHADGSDITAVVTSNDHTLYDLSWQPLPSASDTVWPAPTPVLTLTTTPTQSPVVHDPNDFAVPSGTGHIVAELYSPPGESVGGGVGRFTVEDAGRLETSGWWVSITVGEANRDWQFSFFAPYLDVGKTYENVTQLDIPEGSTPAMAVTAPHQMCSSLHGEFTIEQAVPEVVINFTQRCDSQEDPDLMLSGTLRFKPGQ